MNKNWSTVPLSLITKEINIKSSENNQFPVITSSLSGIYIQTDYFKKIVASANNIGYKIISPGQFTYRSMSDDGVFKINRYKFSHKGIVSPAYSVFEVINADASFIEHLFDAHVFSSKLYKIIQGGTRLALKYKILKKIQLELPPIHEQKKIASILTSVDDVIEKIQAQINKLQDLKKAIMNELLTRGIVHTEFKDSDLGRIPKNWDVFCIDDIAFVTKLAGFEYSEYFDYSIGGDIITIRALNLKNGKLDLKQVQTISKSVSDKLPRSKLKKGDLVISYVGTVGEVALIEKSEKFHLAPNVAKITPNQEKVLSEFLLHNLISDKTKKLIMLLGTITSQPSINMGNIRKILISLPPIKEQRKICNIFSSIDNFIEVKIKKLKKYKSLKKSLMQDLLTGKVRVKVN